MSAGPPPPEEPILITEDMLVPSHARDERADFESGMSYAPPLTLLVIALNAAVFVWELTTGALASQDAIIAAGALYRPLVLDGEYWRLVSPVFLHASADHLIGNCMALYVLGMACEHAVGAARMAGLYLASGIGGAVGSLLIGGGPSVGASGAIFGVMGAVAIVLHMHQDRFHVRDKRISVVLAGWALFTIATGLLSPYVDNAAHVGGFLCGAALGLQLEPRDRDA